MTKKKINIVLLLVLLGIWGIIIYRFASGYFIKNENLYSSKLNNHYSKMKITHKDTFELVNPKRDPFLEIEYKEKNTVIVAKPFNKSYTSVEKKQPLKINTPIIHYFGYIFTENNQSSALLKINNGKVKLALNQEHDGVKLVSIYRDSIKVIFNKQTKVIYKQK